MELSGDDARKLLAAKAHLGSTNCNYQMKQYVFKRNDASGAHVFDLQKMWEKIMLAARIIAAVENPQDVCFVSSKDLGQRATLKAAKFIGASSNNGRFSPGTFTNHSQTGFREPRLIMVTDPTGDHQAVREASYVNIPVIGFCDADTPIKYIDVVIPINNRAAHSVGLIYWFIAREVQRLRGTLSRIEEWSVMPDLFFYRDQEEIKKQEEDEKRVAEEGEMPAEEFTQEGAGEGEWTGEAAPTNEQNVVDDWNTQPAAATQDWAAESAPTGGDWAAAEPSSWN